MTETLDSLETTLDYVNRKISEYSSQLANVNYDSVTPLNFQGLRSVDTAKATLQTFFKIILDMNVYKRDLENKCLE